MNLFEYVKKYNYTFKEREFNEVDNLVFAVLAYVDYNNVLGNTKESLLEVANKFNKLHNKNYFKLSYEEDGVNLNLSIDYKNNTSASEFDSNYNIVLRINELTISDYVKLNINDNKEILEIDKENSKKIDDITAEEEEQIYNKLFEIPLISSYMNMYDNLNNSNDLNTEM